MRSERAASVVPANLETSAGKGPFPRAEILLACGLALALRFVYVVGVAQGPLFLHPIIDVPAGHSYGWFLAAISGLTGNDPLAPRVVQALVDAGSVFLLRHPGEARIPGGHGRAGTDPPPEIARAAGEDVPSARREP